jgi:hypothetical protein
MKYVVAITEELQRELEVEAESKEQAYEIVKRKYNNEEIVLDDSDYSGTEIDVWAEEGLVTSKVFNRCKIGGTMG